MPGTTILLSQGNKVKPEPEPGYVYLYRGEDGTASRYSRFITDTSELIRFCWRKRADLAVQPQYELTMVPGDATFTPYLNNSDDSQDKHSPTNGRIYVLRFSSSSDRHFFWMQAKSQHKDGTPSWFSSRDQKIGEVINELLSGEEVDVEGRLGSASTGGGGSGEEADDAMQDVQESGAGTGGGGGAGQDATGGDPRQEGEESRRGGEDGGRA